MLTAAAGRTAASEPVAAAVARGRESGSTFVLFPFAVLIVLTLGGLAVDAAILFGAHRETVDVATAVADDLAGALDERAFATTGEVRIDRVRADRLLRLANRDLADHPHELQCSARLAGAPFDTAAVACTGRTRAVLLPAAGIAGDVTLRATATATLAARG